MKKHIYIYSPSSAVRDKASFKRGIKRLQALGHEVEVDEAALAKYQRFAGDDDTRLAAIHRAAVSGADVASGSRPCTQGRANGSLPPAAWSSDTASAP